MGYDELVIVARVIGAIALGSSDHFTEGQQGLGPMYSSALSLLSDSLRYNVSAVRCVYGRSSINGAGERCHRLERAYLIKSGLKADAWQALAEVPRGTSVCQPAER